jgi:hypothetical protein
MGSIEIEGIAFRCELCEGNGHVDFGRGLYYLMDTKNLSMEVATANLKPLGLNAFRY